MTQITPEERAAPQPVAWMRADGEEGSISTMTVCISAKVKDLWLKANPVQVERYTIPLYASPVLPEAPKAPEWIPVSERLPVSGMYLTVIVGDDVGVSHIDVSAFTASLDAWSIHWNEEVTHWMPLPAAPTTEEAPKEKT
jgi:hypothetical protein